MEEVKTRKDEIVIVTSDPEEMAGKYIAETVRRSWNEPFIDEDTGETIDVKRYELIAERGELLTEDLITSIMFYIQTGDIQEIKVSNQCRKGINLSNLQTSVWSVVVKIVGKKHKFLLYAQGIHQAMAIVQDYVELKFEGVFEIVSAKEYSRCIFVQDQFRKESDIKETPKDEEGNEIEMDKRFYMIDAKITDDKEMQDVQTFLVSATDVESAKAIIEVWVDREMKKHAERTEQNPDDLHWNVTVECASIVKCSRVISREFSNAYVIKNDENE